MSTFISWKAQPLFISSTFTDMMAERDALRDFVFPELAERLRARHIHLEPIDLRWGVETSNKKEQEEKELLVLKVCLDEIDRCKPFLIGIIGDRYGWVPPAGRMKAAENEKNFISVIENKSITALEIEYGVLANTEQMKRSRFYFRAPLDYDQMPADRAKEFSDMHNAELDKDFSEQRLVAYKALIVAKVGKEKVYEYSDLDDFKQKVLEQIWSELDAETKDQEDHRPKTWQQEERLFLEEFIEERTIAFSGREDVINHLKDFAKSPAGYDNCGLCITGESGSGKSALFAKLHKELQKENLFVLAHAAGISLRSNSLENMLLIWIEELGVKLKLDLSEQLKYKNKFDDLTKLFAELLSRTAVDHRVIVLVDALNQFERTAHAKYVNWLPELLPANVKFIFTAIPGEETANLSKRKGVKVEELKAVTKFDAEEIIRAICKRYHKNLDKAVTGVLLNIKIDEKAYAYSNPLWLNMAVDEFLLLDEDDFGGMKAYAGTAEEKLKQLLLTTAHEMPADIEGMYAYLFDKTRLRFGKDFVNAFLSYIALTRYGLRESDLEKLITENATQKWDDLKFAALRRYLRAHIVRKGEEGLWDFKHVQVRAGIKKILLVDKKHQELHNIIAFYLMGLPRNDALQISETMYHLMQADNQEKSAVWYGSFLTNQSQTSGSSAAMAIAMIEDEIKNKSFWIDWVISLLEYADRKDISPNTLSYNLLFSLFNDYLFHNFPLHKSIKLIQALEHRMEELCNMNPENEKYSSDLSVCYKILTSLYSESAELTKSLKYCQKSLTIWEKLYKRTPDSKLYLVGLAAALHDLGGTYFRLGDLDNALYYYMESYKKNEDLHKRNQILHANNLSDIGFSIGDIFLKWGETEKAIIYYQKSCDILEILCKVPNESQSQLPFLCTGYSRLGGAFLEIGKLQKANSSYLSAFSLAKKLYQLAPNDTPRACLLSNSYTKLGAFYLRMGNFTKSEENLEASLAILEGLHQNIPDSAYIQRGLAEIYNHIGDLFIETKLPLKGLEKYQSSLNIIEKLQNRALNSADFSKDLSTSLHRLVNFHYKQGNKTEFIKYATRCCEVLNHMKETGMYMDKTSLNLQKWLENEISKMNK